MDADGFGELLLGLMSFLAGFGARDLAGLFLSRKRGTGRGRTFGQ